MQAVFIAGGLVTLVVMLPAARSLVRDRSLLIATGVVVGVTAISALWSVAPDRTSQQALMFLVGTELDYVEDKLGAQFVFRNPNEKARCGCGESFSV